VYAKNLIAHRATDNRILIEFVNQDQKPTPLDGLDFIFRIISTDGAELLLEKPLEIVNKAKGQARVVISEQELDSIAPGILSYSIERHYFPFTPPEAPIEPPEDPDGPVILPVYPPTYECNINGNPGPADPVNPEDFQAVEFEPTFVDDQAGGRGVIEVVDSIMPAFVSSKVLTIPELVGLNTTDSQRSGEYHTSIIDTDAQESYTFQLAVTDFTGTITFQGGTDTDNLWYDIISNSYDEHNEIIGAIVDGYHPYLRINITDNTDGAINTILYR